MSIEPRETEAAIDRFQDAVIDREHCQTAYRRSCQREFEEAKEALRALLAVPSPSPPPPSDIREALDRMIKELKQAVGDEVAQLNEAEAQALLAALTSSLPGDGKLRIQQLEEAVSLADNYLRTIHPTGVEDGDYICTTIRAALSVRDAGEEKE